MKEVNTKSTYCMVLFILDLQKRETYRNRKQICGYLGLGAETKCKWASEKFGGMMKCFTTGPWLYNFIDLYLVNLICKLYLNKKP